MDKVLTRAAGWSRFARFAVLAACGVVAGLGQAPLDMWPATIVAVALVFIVHDRSIDPRQAAFHIWAFGVGYFGFSLRWIVEPFLVDIARHGWMAPFAIMLMAGGAAFFWAMAGYAAKRLAPRNMLFFGMAIVAVEVIRSLILTGFPWALLGHVWISTPVAQMAAFGGPHLLTLLTIMTAWAVVQLVVGRRIIGGAFLVGLVAAALILRPGSPPERVADAPTVRIVQPNAPQHQKWDPVYRDIFVQRLLDYSAAGEVPDLVVWPETAMPTLLNYIEDELSILADAARGAPLIFGIQRQSPEGDFFNSFVVLDGGGQISDLYDKTHLVPFGEYVPGGDIPGRLGFAGLADRFGGGFTSGDETAMVQVPGIGWAIPLICYEGIFAEEISRPGDRPRMMVLITNDAWFGQAAGPYQHLAQARLRAIEQGLPMIRAANTGVSAMIDAQGRVLQSIPLGQEGAIDIALPPQGPQPLYARTGELPVIVLLSILALSVFAAGRRVSD
ncbi:apolipoprotein N-acyltransferase [Yoonia sp. 2307UL14-13]|uniref:apolipoprotein N-acyltransferase n=1 Tax=Yoonia sp. 2307UL14-13 TaxID=3126506 RepID=UPI0030B25728